LDLGVIDLVIHCTKKLLEYGKFPIRPVAEVECDPFFRWHANLFVIQKRKCIILMNDLTRYSLVLYGVKKTTAGNFGETFQDILYRNWLFEGIAKERIDQYIASGGELIFAPTYNRSILGSMNDMIYMTGYRMEDYLPTEEMNILELNKINNGTPMLMLEESYPIDELKAVWQI
jgi:hypothetical protein